MLHACSHRTSGVVACVYFFFELSHWNFIIYLCLKAQGNFLKIFRIFAKGSSITKLTCQNLITSNTLADNTWQPHVRRGLCIVIQFYSQSLQYQTIIYILSLILTIKILKYPNSEHTLLYAMIQY